MYEGGLILNVCFLIALAAANPIPQQVNVQTYPGTYCDQSAFRNSLIGSLNGEYTSDKSSIQIDSICPNQNDILKKILYDRIISNPLLIDIINDFQRSNNADISKNIANIVNNYIILPPDIDHGRSSNVERDGTNTECKFNNPNICTRVKKDAGKNPDDLAKGANYNQTNEVTNRQKNQPFLNNNQNVSNDQYSISKMPSNTTITKGNIKKSSKRPSRTKGEPTHDKYILNSKNIDTELLDIESGNKIGKKTNHLKIKSVSKSTSTKEKARNLEELKNNSYKSAERIDKKQQRIRIVNSTNSRNKTNGRTQKHDNFGNGKQIKTQTYEGRKKTDYKRPKEKQSHVKDDNKNKYKVSNNRTRKTFNSVQTNQDYQFPNMPYDSTSMYKYIDSIMSNYQSSNKHDFPFNFNNFYQLPQLSNSWNSKQQNRNKSHRRRKYPKFNRRKQNKKRVFSRRKPIEKKVSTGSVDEINRDSNKIDITTPSYSLELKENPYVAIIQKDNETIISIENESEQKNISRDETEKENIATTIFDELSFINNSLSEETFYNSKPSFIVGIDENVPIIFESSLIDDYYPDFTTDNEALLTTDEKHTIKYHNDKYHYVSKQNFDFGDYIKKRKRIAMKNLNKKINLFSSDTQGNQNLITINQEEKGNKDVSNVEFLSPHLLDNPDFRTRKINSNEIYEPYDHHNIYQEPEENVNNYEDDKVVVYSTPMSAKDNPKIKSCNDITDSLTKWRKIKDTNVETVHARSKLAKYGLAL